MGVVRVDVGLSGEIIERLAPMAPTFGYLNVRHRGWREVLPVMRVTEVHEQMRVQCALVREVLWRRLAGDAQAARECKAMTFALERPGGRDVFEDTVAEVHAAVLAAVDRVTRSSEMRRKRLLHVVLRVIVDHTLATGEPLKQIAIAIEVYGERVASTKGQGAVASEIARLRRTLDAYYQGSGAADSVRLRIPRGRNRQIAIVTRSAQDAIPEAHHAAPSLIDAAATEFEVRYLYQQTSTALPST